MKIEKENTCIDLARDWDLQNVCKHNDCPDCKTIDLTINDVEYCVCIDMANEYLEQFMIRFNKCNKGE